MTARLLLTNDDGIDSPALFTFAAALDRLGEVTVVVPERERSWIGKAITRHDPLSIEEEHRQGRTVYSVAGYPADCTQLGVDLYGGDGPDLVVSGINVGYNHGEAFVLSSGTVGAALEAAIREVPAVAMSAGTIGHWPTWHAMAWSAESAPMWERLAKLGAALLEPIIERGFPADANVVSFNLPEGADLDTERRITRLAPSRYGSLFRTNGDGELVHAVSDHRVDGRLEGTDIQAARDAAVSITPLMLPATGSIPQPLMEAWGAIDDAGRHPAS